MRVMSLLSLCFGFAVFISGLVAGRDLSQVSVIVGIFVGAAFGGKVAQKFGETSGK
jgi:hypothetical protein